MTHNDTCVAPTFRSAGVDHHRRWAMRRKQVARSQEPEVRSQVRRHSRAGGNPRGWQWSPAFAGVTALGWRRISDRHSRASGNPPSCGTTILAIGPSGRDSRARHSHSRASGNPGLLALLFALMLLAVSTSSAQVLTGIPPFSSVRPSSFDTVNNANLNVHFSIPIFSRAGRGGFNFSYALSYDSSIWQNASGQWIPYGLDWGWRGTAGALTGYATANHTMPYCTVGTTRLYYDQYSN